MPSLSPPRPRLESLTNAHFTSDITSTELSSPPIPTPNVLELGSISHAYDNAGEALVDVSLSVAKGEVLGLLGPNGAGKSSLLKISCGLLAPNSGTVRVLGRDLREGSSDVKRRVCALLQQSPMEPNMKVYEVLELFSSFYKNPLSVETLLGYVEMSEKRDAFVKTLSGGQRQRVALARAMVGNPDLLILDEPTTGLDISMRTEFLNLIRKLKADGHSVLFSTHLVDEAEAVCDRVAVLNRGVLFGCDTPERLVREFGSGDRLEVISDAPIPSDAITPILPDIRFQALDLPDHPFAYSFSGAQAESLLVAITQFALTHNIPLRSVKFIRAGLESAYLNLTGERILA